MKLRCLITGHEWSEWCPTIVHAYLWNVERHEDFQTGEYRYCMRCSKHEARAALAAAQKGEK